MLEMVTILDFKTLDIKAHHVQVSFTYEYIPLGHDTKPLS